MIASLPMPALARAAALLAACVLGATAAAADLAFNQSGLAIAVKGMGEFTLSYPKLLPGDRKPVERTVNGRHAELTYPGGITASLDATAAGVLEIRFRNVPEDVQKFHQEFAFGSQYGDGGSWRIGGGPVTPFPAEKPPKPFLYQGNAGTFTLVDPAGRSLSFGVPDYAYQQLQDNREWRMNAFSWNVWIPYNRGWTVHAIRIGEVLADVPAAAPAAVAKQVDRFGQTTRKDFPGKVKDEAELKADAADEAAYYAGLKPMATDAWGGLPGSKERLGLQATGFFHVEKKGERWILADPDGNAFFHLGICSFGYAPGEDATYIKDRRDIYEWLPGTDGEFAAAWHPEKWWHDQVFSFFQANLIRKYGPGRTRDQQLAAMVDRVRAMGFNSIGAFSGDTPAFAEKRIPRMAMVGVRPELPGIRGVSDPFDEATLTAMDESWAKSVAPKADDPLIIGYFFANEQGFEDIPRGVPQLKGKHAAKRRLVEQLKKTYPTIAEFNAAWGVQAADFAAVADMGLPVQTRQAFADMKAYTELFLDTYFRTITETFRKHDRNHLMVSNRWQPGTANNEALCRAAGRYMDVISINYYAMGVDRDFIRRLYGWTGGKPQMWSEFYYTSGAESNCAAGGNDMATQQARGQAYRNYVEAAADLGIVVGIEWFTLIDQAVTGRWFEKLSGERANTGIFNVADRPYRAMVAEMAQANTAVYGVWLDGKKPYVIDDPRFAPGAGRTRRSIQAGRVAPGAIAIDGALTGWPGRPPERIGADQLVSGKDAQGFEAAFKLCWDEANLYLLANVTDPTPMNNPKSGGHLWAGDGVELFIGSENLDQPGTLLFSDHQVLIGAKSEAKDATWVVNAPQQPAIPLAVAASVDGTGYVLEAAIPWAALGVAPKEGQELIFDIAVDDAPKGGDRTRQLMWNGGQRNSADRSYWGRLQLVP